MPICSKCKAEYPVIEKNTTSYCKPCRAEYARQWRKRNKEKVKKQNQNWYQNGGNVKKQIYDKKRLQDVRIRDKNRYESDPQFRMSKVLRTRFRKTLNGKEKKGTTLKILGCSKEFLIDWISYQFEKDMNWSNYGKEWNIDHVKPCSSFDLTVEEEQEKCFHWTNLRPMYCKDNFQKGNKIRKEDLDSHNKILKSWVEKINVSGTKVFWKQKTGQE